ncbi:branched-chain amino acid ABC transporter permease [Paraburkholderia sp. J63]|uniref:branched-chain amino acid ABC transporter permease n=1 Tax=Paraburkholderia sp. J63 TaxID=2805434 RepID=UPI002ABD79F1|nr:branched-chain amino acid ABC transporter permease [Paraburkholderia sp. J63]
MLSIQLLVAAISTGAVYALVSLGLNLVYGTLRVLNVAHGDLAMIGGYVAYWAFAGLGIEPLIALPFAALVCGLAGWGAYRGVFRRLLARGEPVAQLEANSLLLFFGVSTVLQNVASLAFSSTPRAYAFLDSIVHVGGVALAENRLIATLVALAVCGGIWLFLSRHPFGLAMRGLIDHRQAALVVGIDNERVQVVSFVLGFATAGVAGVLISMVEAVSPSMGGPLLVAAFVVAILGGLGRIGGGICAAFLLGALDTFGVALTSPEFRSVLLYGVFVVILLFRPQGLFSKAVSVR